MTQAAHRPCTRMKRTAYYYPPAQIDRLRTISAETGLPVAELIRRAIDSTYPLIRVGTGLAGPPRG